MSKNKKVLLLTLVLFIVFGFLFALPIKGAGKLEVNWPTAPGGKELTAESSLVDFVEYTYRWGILLGGLAAFIALIMAGFKYLTSVGDPMKMREARDGIVSALLGLVLLLSTFIILNTLNPELTTLTPPTTEVPGLGTGSWGAPEWDKPCEWVNIYEEKNYQEIERNLTSVNFDKCIVTGWGGFLGIGGWENPINSVRIKGACQLNLYEQDNCKGNFVAIGKSMSNLEWIGLSHVYAIKVTDIAPPKLAEVENVGISSLQKTSGKDTWEVRLTGHITDMGRADVVFVFFEYGTNDLYLDKRAPLNPEKDALNYMPGDFSSTVTELATSTEYYWRAVVRSEAGTNFATIATFTTGF